MDWSTIIKGLAVIGTIAVLLLGVPRSKEDAKHLGIHFAAIFASLLATVVIMLVVMKS